MARPGLMLPYPTLPHAQTGDRHRQMHRPRQKTEGHNDEIEKPGGRVVVDNAREPLQVVISKEGIDIGFAIDPNDQDVPGQGN